MKLNLDFYNENDNKVEETNKENIENIFSDFKVNIISWYPFKTNSKILEIGADSAEITAELCQKAEKIISITSSKKIGQEILNNNEDKKNLEIIVGNLEDIKLNEKFDYITIIGAEKLNIKLKKILEYSKKFLNENGIILLAIDNKLGVKYFSTLKENGEKITNLLGKNCYSLNDIENEIKNAGFENKKIYYPLTDYKMTNVIFTDDFFISKSNLSRNIDFNEKNTIKFYEQNDLFEELLAEKEVCKYFINSFFFEIFSGEVTDNNIKMISYSNMRKKEYRIKTIVTNKYVYKYPMNSDSEEHIYRIKENIDLMRKKQINTVDSYDNEKIISTYVSEKNFAQILMDTVKDNKEETIELLKKYKTDILEKLKSDVKGINIFDKYNIEYDKDRVKKLEFTQYGLWDLIFQNCFYIKKKFYFYDQEWRLENIPIVFIFYRAIKYLNKIKKYISTKELYAIFDINDEDIELLDKLDDKIQEEIRDEIAWEYNKNGKSVEQIKIDQLTSNHRINLLSIDIENNKNEIICLKNENNSLKAEIIAMKNSKTWKIAEIIRKIKKRK
ncbi:MAG: hypothetical protein IKG42_05595 [Clostridia bacterium]|nr:hypothetical protein [Clostridia bacterium]